MPLGPFDPIPQKINGRPNVVRVEHINDMREALTGLQDAYDVAVANGFTGTRVEWLQSLIGPPGPQGPQGQPGQPGSGAPSSVALYDPPVDVWPAFDANGGAGSWNALTYGGWIAGIDALFAAELGTGAVAKADLGLASDGVSHVYSYTAGLGPVRVLLIGGHHGGEVIGQYALMRWVESLVRSTHPAMAQLRNLLRVTWIPTLNPSVYPYGRTNGNDIDINRNYAFYWGTYVSSGPADAKGAAAFDQPESRMVRDLVLTNRYQLAIDCHNYSPNGLNSVDYGLPSDWLLSNRTLALGTALAWQRVYNAGGTLTQTRLSSAAMRPNATNWLDYAMRSQRGVLDAAVLTLEASGDLAGSTQQLVTQGAMRAYNGFVTLFLQRWLAEGGAPTPVPQPYTMYAQRTGGGAGVSITVAPPAFGARIDTTTNTPITWHDVYPPGGLSPQNYLNIPLLYAPALLTVTASGYLNGDSTAETRVNTSVEIDGVDGIESYDNVYLPAGANSRGNFLAQSHQLYTTLDAVTIPKVRLMIRRVTGGTAELQRARLEVTVTPHTDTSPIPRANP